MRLPVIFIMPWWYYFIAFFLGCLSLMAQATGVVWGGDMMSLLGVSGLVLGAFIPQIIGVFTATIAVLLGYFSPLFLNIFLKSKHLDKSALQDFSSALTATFVFAFSGILLGYAVGFILRLLWKKWAPHFKGRTTFKG